MKTFLLTSLAILLSISVTAQCPEDFGGVIWKTKGNMISFEELALHAAPMLWFSPDEVKLHDENGNKQLPNAFPFDDRQDNQSVVYYKLRHIYSQDKETVVLNPESYDPGRKLINLKNAKALDLDFYYYFREEFGQTGHLHDLESIALQMQIIETEDCPEYKYAIRVKKVTGRAHGVEWYHNVLEVDAQTFFPLSILIEEGKHASCTDKNADGTYTPTYDVTERINDAWGIRDIITSGRLVSGKFQAWMAKKRERESIVFPPFPKESPFYKKYQQKFGSLIEDSQYELRPYPDYRKIKEELELGKELDHLMKGKKPHQWPEVERVSGDGSIRQWIKEEKSFRSLTVSYRVDDSQRLSLAFPLFLFKNVEAPRTGGWIYNKVYIGGFDNMNRDTIFDFQKLVGHQITYSSSASNWIDSYFGLGYEIIDVRIDPLKTRFKPFFVSEAGVKLRFNIKNTKFKFLRIFGTEFWGLKLGWKNVGFSPFKNSGFVVELGAGVF